MPIPYVGKCFATSDEFLAYLEAIKFGAWRPRYVVMHHTGAPDLKTWQGWQTRAKPVTDEQWMKNLAGYYGETMRWSSGPQFFFTPNHFCVLSPPDRRGVHAVSFNANSWGVECVGDFDREDFTPALRDRYAEGLACLHIATGLQLAPYERGVRGLHFHRDDPKTSKTCPGKKVGKAEMIAAVQAKIVSMSDGETPDEHVVPAPAVATRTGTVNIDDLNVRADASAKAPVVREIEKGATVTVKGAAMNGETKWLEIEDGWVSARFVDLKQEI